MGQSYRDLIAWQKAMDFVMDVYRTSKGFPRDELYGLASQLRRAAVAVPTAKTGRLYMNGEQADRAFRLVNTVAARRLGRRTARAVIERTGATMGKKPSAATRAAV